jgi:gamma-glutamylcyclotransferase (GGCT)/AIG2-like uncharacterized protein YtfP
MRINFRFKFFSLSTFINKMGAMKQNLLTHGALMKGFSNHYLLKWVERVGAAKTLKNYYISESGITSLFGGEAVSRIYAELYRVDELTLEIADRLEGHPEWYRREKIQIVTDLGNNLTGWLYFYPEKRGTSVKSGRATATVWTAAENDFLLSGQHDSISGLTAFKMF